MTALCRTAIALAIFAGACASHPTSTTDEFELQPGQPVVWPAPADPQVTPPTLDRSADRGIWGSGK